jgi:hypothetical protein
MRDQGEVMRQEEQLAAGRGVTRGGMLRGLIGGAALAGAAVGARRGAESVEAAPSQAMDARIAKFYLGLEQIQIAFYGDALDARQLDGELLKYTLAVREQEKRHAAFLANWLKGTAPPPPRTNFGDKLNSPESFRAAAVQLEEMVIAGYIGQAAHLTFDSMRRVATLVSVEARQVAWLRNIADVSPAPRAADPPTKADDVMTLLHDKGYLA